MYTIHANGQLLFDSLSEKSEDIALSPKVSLDVNDAGSVKFVLPPGNRMHGGLKKLKSIITVEQDGEQLVRGRVMEIETDTYNQQSVYCEGEKAFLMDSVHSPYTYSGTVRGLFRKLMNNHNAMVDAEKQFVIGEITAVSDTETTAVECEVYSSTSSEIEERLLNAYGGYLRTRTVDGVQYIDWLEQYGDANEQPIEFSVNMLDLTDKADAGDVFTVLIPLGASEIGEDGEYTDPLSVASVNGGKNYIQDDEAVTLYGKIWRTYTWNHITDAGKLLEKAREYMKTGVALETITLKAIDMHFVDGNVQPLRLGDKVRILSNPHGLDKVMVCSQIEIDLVNPENTLYTFGEKPRTLTDNVVKTKQEVGSLGGGGGRKSVKEEISDIIRWAKIIADEQEAYIQLTAGEFNKVNENLSAVQIELDGVEAEMSLAASRVDNLEDRTTSAEIALAGAEAKITLHAESIEDLGQSISNAEIAIDGLNSEITLKADKIDLQGYVTADELEAEVAAINRFFTGNATASILNAESITGQHAQFTNVSLINYDCAWRKVSMGDVASGSLLGTSQTGNLDLQHSHEVTVNDDGTITLGEVSSSGGSFKIADTKAYKDGVSAARSEGYTSGKTDWSPVKIERTSYSTADKTVTVRALNAAGVPLIGLEKIDASEIYEAGANAAGSYEDGYTDGWDDAADGVVISNGTPQWTVGTSTVTFKIRVYARLNGTTIESTDLEFSKRI